MKNTDQKEIEFPLSDRPVTVVISDLHIGGGESDKGDDHVERGEPLIRFIDTLPQLVDAPADAIELVINGDFLEFAQTASDEYDWPIADGYWCSADESLAKVKVIIQGNGDIWTAMRAFQSAGGLITVAAGNHDVDLAWESVRAALTTAAGPLVYAIGQDWLVAYGGALRIAHGHAYDPANRFENWHNPILPRGSGVSRLEMCPGTMFMVKFVNPMEHDYPFADNIVPETALAEVLRNDGPARYLAMLWLLGKFGAQHPQHSVGVDERNDFSPDAMFSRYRVSAAFRASVDAEVEKVAAASSSWQPPEAWQDNVDAFNDVVLALLARMGGQEWQRLFDLSGTGTVGVYRASRIIPKLKQVLMDEAQAAIIKHGARVVVMGHTHQPDEVAFAAGQYFNPGSWTRYADVSSIPHLKLTDLMDEKRFPYDLNFIEIRRDTEGTVQGRKRNFERAAGTLT